MNLINYSPYQFDDTSIVSGSVAMENALMFDSLQPDELTVEVISNDTGKRKLLTVDREWYTTVNNRGYVLMTTDIRKFTYGDPVLYYYDGVLQGKYFIRSVERLSVDHFRLSAYSAVGLWTNIQHFGGIYSGETAGEIIADLLQGYTYTIDPDVAAVPMYGYLPIASIRDNLRQVLFAIGAALLKDSNGNPRFKFLSGLSPISVSDERIYIGGKLTYKTPATEVVVTEHSYYQSTYDIQVSLFDNTDGSGTADNKLVTFKNPCHTLAATGTLTINSSGANYAYVSGTGVLSGYEYTHTTKVFSVPTGVNGETKTATIDKATLLSPVNSANIAARVSDYESTAEEVACGIVMDTDDIKPASLVSFTDPYGDATQGIVATMNITMSGKSKADCTIVKGYVPSHFGNNFTSFQLLTSSGTYTATKTGTIRIVLGQGGQGGQGGWMGARGNCGEAGVGGAYGTGGAAGRIYVNDIEVTAGQTFSYTIGTGGAAGTGQNDIDTPPTDGAEGTHSTFGSYTSANGAAPNNGYVNILTGLVYSENGEDGISGGNGGGANQQGESVTFNGTTWVGGQPAPSVGNFSPIGGGGAAYGSNGEDATPSRSNYHGTGGDGATAQIRTVSASLGSGGVGGNGGGGAGAAPYDRSICWGTAIGYAGNGSDGNDGGSGYILVFE